MASPILVTKLFVPPTRAELVPRPGLIERLNDGLDRKLTLLSAPAGFGKTTLVSHWVENLRNNSELDSQSIKVAWLSLDQDDNDSVRFLNYFITALNQIDGIETDLGQCALSMLQLPQPPSPKTVLISLINDLAAIPEKSIFVLDDYHLIESKSIHQALVFLLENLPPQLHLVIATRQDPSLSLGLLRARDQLTELRAEDLRFTSSEIADFLNQVMGLNLSSEDIAELETRTEGWIAGLQLAAISMQRRQDRSGFIKSFTGGQRLVLDFLIEEVLGQQPESVQNFLLQTAILNRMTGSLCDALTGQDIGHQTLEMLDRANLFIVPLDNERHWYRYHHLFADLLRTQLQKSLGAEDVKQLHLRAVAWHEKNGLIIDAIHHASIASDIEMIERLIEQNYKSLIERGEMSHVNFWMGTLPKELIFQRPWLCLFEALSRSWFGELYEAAQYLAEAQKRILSKDLTAEAQYMLGYHDYVKSRVIAMQGNLYQAIELCLTARDNILTNNLGSQNWVSIKPVEFCITLGYEYFLYGDFGNAKKELHETIRLGSVDRAINAPVAAYAILARMSILQGQLHEAYEILQAAAQLFQESDGEHFGARGLVEVEKAGLLYEWNDVDTAFAHLEKGLNFLPWWGKRDDLCLAYSTLSRFQLSQGNRTEAESTIEKAVQLIKGHRVFSEARSAVETAQVKIWLAQEDWAAINHWENKISKRLGSNDENGFQDELARITQARVLITKNQIDEAVCLLSNLEESTRANGRQYRLIEITILQALASQTSGDMERALKYIEQALNLAEPKGFIRIFVDEGPPMAHLLYEALKREIAPEYVQQLLAAFPVTEPEETDLTKPQVDQSGLIEPLSDREIEVLQLIAKGLTNQEISNKLFLSMHTVKTHTRNIYSKLGAHHRAEAVAKARAFGIL
jgi:LuxR family maltose regulon positive regulatory protein